MRFAIQASTDYQPLSATQADIYSDRITNTLADYSPSIAITPKLDVAIAVEAGDVEAAATKARRLIRRALEDARVPFDRFTVKATAEAGR